MFRSLIKHFCRLKVWIQLHRGICFRTEATSEVARILSNKYIWLLLKYKTTDELGTHSYTRRKNICYM